MNGETLTDMLAQAAHHFEGKGENARKVAAIIYLTEVAVLVGDLPEFLEHCRGFSKAQEAKKRKAQKQ